MLPHLYQYKYENVKNLHKFHFYPMLKLQQKNTKNMNIFCYLHTSNLLFRYDNFLHVCFEALSTESGAKSAASALVCGSHFLEKKDAEQIFDAIITSNHYDLIYSCIKQVKLFF